MSTGGGNTTTTQRSDPWMPIQPYLTDAASQAQQLNNRAQSGQMNYYGGDLVAPFGATTQQGMGLTTDRALAGSPGIKAGQGFIQSGLSGPATPAYSANSGMFGSASNPYLDATFNKAALQTQNQLASEFGRSGRNIGASQGLRGQQLNDLATNIYGGAYESERNRMANELGQNQSINANAAESAAARQQNLLNYGIPYANQDYNDLQQLASVGKAQDTRSQGELDANISRYMYNQQVPQQALNDYARLITGSFGNYGTTSTTQPTNRNALGGALGGAAAGSAFGPWGALGGGLLGGIFG